MTKPETIQEIIHHNQIESYEDYLSDFSTAITPKEDYTRISVYYVKLAVYGDYIGCSVERANFNCLKDMFDFHIKQDCYFTRSLVFSENCLNQWTEEKLTEFLEILNALDDYPLISDEEMSSLENGEMFDENWDNWCKWDFYRFIGKKLEKLMDSEKNDVELARYQEVYDKYEDMNDDDFRGILRDLLSEQYGFEYETGGGLVVRWNVFEKQFEKIIEFIINFEKKGE